MKTPYVWSIDAIPNALVHVKTWILLAFQASCRLCFLLVEGLHETKLLTSRPGSVFDSIVRFHVLTGRKSILAQLVPWRP